MKEITYNNHYMQLKLVTTLCCFWHFSTAILAEVIFEPSAKYVFLLSFSNNKMSQFNCPIIIYSTVKQAMHII